MHIGRFDPFPCFPFAVGLTRALDRQSTATPFAEIAAPFASTGSRLRGLVIPFNEIYYCLVT